MTDKIQYDTGYDSGKEKVLPDPPTYVPRPSWQDFPGFSFIFNNPGEPLKSHSKYQQIHIDEDHLKKINLYAKLSEAVNKINPAALAQRFHFFDLPPSTYHVTVWDGINKGIENRLDPLSRQQFRSYFEQGIKSVIKKWPPFGEHLDYTKRFDDVGTIRLHYGGLRARGSTVLVARLETDPNDSESNEVLNEIRKRRESLDKDFANYGKPENYILQPHVAIGYFSDSHLADSALFQHMDTWMGEFDRIVKGSMIEFKDISLYAFTNMITYFKPI